MPDSSRAMFAAVWRVCRAASRLPRCICGASTVPLRRLWRCRVPRPSGEYSCGFGAADSVARRSHAELQLRWILRLRLQPSDWQSAVPAGLRCAEQCVQYQSGRCRLRPGSGCRGGPAVWGASLICSLGRRPRPCRAIRRMKCDPRSTGISFRPMEPMWSLWARGLRWTSASGRVHWGSRGTIRRTR